MGDVHTVENFHGVYLLYCTNPKYKGRTYIGYTVNPNRRIKQHNKGKKAGGAWKTSNRGPWDMVMIIHGFPNDISALRFEWAWQHPQASRRLRHVTKKTRKESTFEFCLRLLSEMLLVPPWVRLPLTIRWLKQEYSRDFPPGKAPPMHMPICYGPVISKKVPLSQTEATTLSTSKNVYICYICNNLIEDKKLICLNNKCDLVSHIICLTKKFLEPGEYIPIEGKCPKCDTVCLWGDLIRKYKGCYNNSDIEINVNDCNKFSSSDSE